GRTLASFVPTVSKAAALFLVLVANSAYLAARADPTVFYFANIVLHLVLGAGLCAHVLVRHGRTWRAWPGLLRAAAPLLAVAAVFGGVLVVVGATRAHRWMLWT